MKRIVPASVPARRRGRSSTTSTSGVVATLCAALLGAGCGAVPLDLSSTASNGADVLCGKRFDEVAYACTHNAMSNAEEGWEYPNQNLPIRRQLDDGVRALMLDVHPFEGGPHLCHGLCALGLVPLVDGLRGIRTFLEDEPREVVSLLFESYVSPQELEAAVEEAGLLPFLHVQSHGQEWPTLGAMIDSGRRLVVFTQDDAGPADWLHGLYDFAAETPYDFQSPEEMDCSPNRGGATNELFLVNHFLTKVFGDRAFAEVVNRNPFLRDRVERCREERQFPNFVAVDFYDIGDVMQVVRELNGISDE